MVADPRYSIVGMLTRTADEEAGELSPGRIHTTIYQCAKCGALVGALGVAAHDGSHGRVPLATASCAADVNDWGPHDFRRLWRISGRHGAYMRDVCDAHLPPFLEDGADTTNTVVCIRGGGR